MIKKIFFLILLTLTIISFGCNVYDEIIDAAIVDQADQNSDGTTTTTTTTTSSDSTTTDTTDTAASTTSSLVTSSANSSLTFPP